MSQIIYGNHEELYDVFNALSIFCCLFVGILFSNRIYQKSALPKIINEENTKSKFATRTVAFLAFIVSYYVVYIIDQALMPVISKIFLDSQSDNYFAVLLASPIIAFVVSYFVKISLDFHEDLIAIFSSTSLVLFKIACTCAGCCYGVAYSGRFYNDYLDEYQVPVQMIELACAVVMFVILMLLFKQKKMTGKLYPLFMLMYSGSRFISEFWRGDFPPVLWRMTGYHILCIIGFVLGAVYMVIASVFGKKMYAYFDKKNDAFGEKLSNYLTYVKQNKPKAKLYTKPLDFCISAVVDLACYMLFIELIFKGLRNVNIYNALFNAFHMNSVGIMLSFILSTLLAIAILSLIKKDTFLASDSNKKSSVIKLVAFSLIISVISAVIGSSITASMISKSLHIILIDIISKLITLFITFILMYLCDKFIIHIDKKDYIK